MEREQKRKVNILRLAIVIVFLVAFAIYIMQLSRARYVLVDSVSIDFSDYYIEVIEPTVTEFGETPIIASFTVKNNNGTDYMTEELKYTISVQENTKWDISAIDELERTIAGGSINSDTSSVTITPKSGITLTKREEITIILTVTDPYPDTKTIKLTYICLPEPTFSLPTINSVTYNASDLGYGAGVNSSLSGTEVIINPNGTQYGPYASFEKGTYNVTITGTNLSSVTVDCVSSFGAISYPITNLVRTSTQVTYTVTIIEATSNVEFRTFTDASTTATVSDIAAAGRTEINGWYSDNVTVTLYKNETDSNIQLQYQLVTNNITSEWINYTEPFIITEEGTTVVNIKNIYSPLPGLEKAGESATVKIDRTTPDSFGISLIGTTSNSITVNGATGDNGGSGIAYYYFSKDDGDTWIGPQTSANYTFEELSQNTTYIIRQKAVDNVGNARISDALTATTKKIVELVFYVPVVNGRHLSGNATWINPGDANNKYITANGSFKGSSPIVSPSTITSSFARATTSNTANFPSNAYYEMDGIGRSNSYNANGNTVTIPLDATITKGVLYTIFGAKNNADLIALSDVEASVTATGVNCTLSPQSVAKNTETWFNELQSNFTIYPKIGDTLAFNVQAKIRTGGGLYEKWVKCAYIYAEFTAEWEE